MLPCIDPSCSKPGFHLGRAHSVCNKDKFVKLLCINYTQSTGQRHVRSTLASSPLVHLLMLTCTHLGLQHSGSCRTKSNFALTGCPVDPKQKRSADPMLSYSNIITPHAIGAFRGGSLSSKSINGKRFTPQPTRSCLTYCII